ETLLKALHPFMPFITEELWHELNERKNKDCIIVASWPTVSVFDQKILEEAAMAFDVVAEIRNTRNTKGLSPKEALKLLVKNGEKAPIKSFWSVVKKLSNISEISFVTDAPSTNATPFLVKSTEFFIPMEGKVDAAKERETILKDLEYQKGFLISVEKKLSNEKFISGAPANVLENERKKKADAEAKIKALEESLARL
ncbi:MAG TPA: class I tRNA ligase family protein, partial [Ohtaekwangia sp.]